MVKDHSDSEKGNPQPPHRLLFPINSNGSVYMHHPTDRITHTTAVVTPVVERWLEREIAQWIHPMKDLSDDPSHHELHLAPHLSNGAPKHMLFPLWLYEMFPNYVCRSLTVNNMY